jgi:diphthine-ammonia ligase
VGQDAIEFVADALGVPLYRRSISGTAVEQGSEYGARVGSASGGGVQGDETEDLYELLSTVKVAFFISSIYHHLNVIRAVQARHPDVQGVSVGAILSNYQRVRVEHV